MSATQLDGGDRRRWQRRQACPGRGRGGDGEHGRRPGLDRQSPRQGSIRHCRGCSSSPRRHSAKRSATPSVWPPPSLSAARSTRAVTSSSACPCICMRRQEGARQAWDQDDADKAERLLRNLVRRRSMRNRASRAHPGVGWTQILTVIRRPAARTPALATCTNIVENALGTVPRSAATSNAGGAEMALRWTAAGLLEAQKTFRRLISPAAHPPCSPGTVRKAQADSADPKRHHEGTIASSTSDACPTNGATEPALHRPRAARPIRRSTCRRIGRILVGHWLPGQR